MKRVLVIAAHPDDEVLGCGATIVGHVQNGDEVHVMIMAEGVTSRDELRNRERHASELSRLVESANEAKEILGISTLSIHGFPDNRMDTVDFLDVVKKVEDGIGRIQPHVVYTHHAGDVNVDHRCVHQAVVTACRPIPQHPVNTLLFFEVPSSTEWQITGSAPLFTPSWFVDVSATLEAKLEALKSYASEMRPWPHSRSYEAVEHLARWRGSNIGVAAAEAFEVGRVVR